MRTVGFNWLRCISVALVSALAPAQASAAGVSPTIVMADIERDGAKKVVARLNGGSGAGWETVRAGIASGKRAWLDVARAIRPGVDAGTGEDLTGALATALRVNPSAVLRLVGSDFQLTQICGVPLIEPTHAQVAAWKRSALAALNSLLTKSLSADSV
jgi:hypothetical protein